MTTLQAFKIITSYNSTKFDTTHLHTYQEACKIIEHKLVVGKITREQIEEVRNMVVSDKFTNEEIAEQYCISKTTLDRWIKKWKEEGQL